MLNHLRIRHFRNFRSRHFDLHPQITLIQGSNGSGKTSLLEAIYFLSQGRSFRSLQLNRLVQAEEAEFTLFATGNAAEEEIKIGLLRNLKGGSRLKLNGMTQKNHLSIMRLMPVQLFNPEQLSQFMSQSNMRRQSLYWGAFYDYPPFLELWQQYRKTLEQRNAALKQKLASGIIRGFDQGLVKLAGEIDDFCGQYVRSLSAILHETIGKFLSETDLQFGYYRGWSKETDLKELIESHLEQDVERGYTFYGPHRADLRFRVRQLPAIEVLSRGQQKLLVSAFKLAQMRLLESRNERQGLLLLDDLLSEFDEHHTQLILDQCLALRSQKIFTCIDHRLSKNLGTNEHGIISLL